MDTKTYDISEIFYSIQGEGRWTGRPMVFVRFAGCNLSCSFCDTKHTPLLTLTAKEVVERVMQLAPQCFTVCFTGGEPTLQLDAALIALFLGNAYKLHLETNGTKVPICCEEFETITVSPKLPKSAENAGIIAAFQKMQNCDLKLLWDDSAPAQLNKMISDWSPGLWGKRFIQPVCAVDGSFKAESKRDIMKFLRGSPHWSLSLQIHKMMGLR